MVKEWVGLVVVKDNVKGKEDKKKQKQKKENVKKEREREEESVG